MRLFEILLTAFLLVSACSLVWRRLRPVVWLMADACVLVVHLILEGGHWQMIPVYAGVLVFAGAIALRGRGWRMAGAAGVVLLCVASIALSALLPMFRLPAPTGPYPVGTRTMEMKAGGRDVVVTVWYPAAASHRPFAAYRRREETTRQSSYQDVLPTNSRLEAPVADGRFPVLLFSPAWGGRRTQNTYLTEDLASHGYVVAAMDHPGNSGPTAYRDGHVDQPATGDAMDFATLSLDEINAEGAKEVEREATDEIGVLDALEGMNQDRESPFYQRLDTTRVGALGHSFGGAVGAEAAIEDGRIKAALDLDGSLFGRMQREGLRKPFMMIEEDSAAVSGWRSVVGGGSHQRCAERERCGGDEEVRGVPDYFCMARRTKALRITACFLRWRGCREWGGFRRIANTRLCGRMRWRFSIRR